MPNEFIRSNEIIKFVRSICCLSKYLIVVVRISYPNYDL